MIQFKKKPEDNLSLYELGEYIKRDGLQEKLSPNVCNNAFKNVDKNHNGSVSVELFLRKAEEEEFKENESGRLNTAKRSALV